MQANTEGQGYTQRSLHRLSLITELGATPRSSLNWLVEITGGVNQKRKRSQ